MKQISRFFAISMPVARYGQAESENCVEIDKKIKRYRDITRSIAEQRTVERPKDVIADRDPDDLLRQSSRRFSSAI